MLAACANAAHLGVDLGPGQADPEIQALARAARAGDAGAQLALGIRFEEGRGVPVDLAKARDLYFAAATVRGADRLTVLPPPTGKGGAPIIIRQSATTATGLPEAAMRWGRLQQRLAPQTVPVPGVAARPDATGFDIGEELADRDALDRLYGEGPLFWALRPGTAMPLDQAVLDGAGAVLLTDETLSRTAQYAAARAGGVAEPDSFCRERLKAADLADPASFRIAALCAGSLCRSGAAIDWGALVAAVPPSASGQGYDREAVTAFGSAGFAMRMAAHCGRSAEAERMGQRVWEHLTRYRTALAECGPAGCTGDRGAALELARAAIANILLWTIENGRPADPRAAPAIAAWTRDAAVDPFAGSGRDAQVENLCRGIGLDYRGCRKSYRYGYFLENRLFDLLGLLARTASAEERDAQIDRFLDLYAIDIEARGARAAVAGLLTRDDNSGGG